MVPSLRLFLLSLFGIIESQTDDLENQLKSSLEEVGQYYL